MEHSKNDAEVKKTWFSLEETISDILGIFGKFLKTFYHSLILQKRFLKSVYASNRANQLDSKYINPIIYLLISLYFTIGFSKVLIYKSFNSINVGALSYLEDYMNDESFINKIIYVLPVFVALYIIIRAFALILFLFYTPRNLSWKIVSGGFVKFSFFKGTEQIFQYYCASLLLLYSIINLINDYIKKIPIEWLQFSLSILIPIIPGLAILVFFAKRKKALAPEKRLFFVSLNFIPIALFLYFLLFFSPIITKNILKTALIESGSIEYKSKVHLYGRDLTDTIYFKIDTIMDQNIAQLNATIFIRNSTDADIVLANTKAIAIIDNNANNNIIFSVSNDTKTDTLSKTTIKSGECTSLNVSSNINKKEFPLFLSSMNVVPGGQYKSLRKVKTLYLPANEAEKEYTQELNLILQ